MTGPGERVLGVGVDLVEIRRLKDSIQRWGDTFTRRVFRDEERAYCNDHAEPAGHYAGRFAVKEAVSKAFGTGIGEHINWLDIEVIRAPTGAPSVQLHDAGADLARVHGVSRILVSLSHTHELAVAQAVLVGPA